MKKRILIFSSLLVILILFSAVSIIINNQQSKSAEADCISIADQLKVCYCILCHEGDANDFDGERCSSDGGVAGPSDDSVAAQGCQIKIRIIDKNASCT